MDAAGRGESPAIRASRGSSGVAGRAATIGLILLAALACRERTVPSPTPAAVPSVSPAATAPATAGSPSAPGSETAAADPSRLIGRWARGDANYVIEVTGIEPDGTLDARYLNPNPIHVSRAFAGRSKLDGSLSMILELQDRNYPGNFYTLSYDPGSDSLTGVYHHLGLNQQFDVAFTRMSPPGERSTPTR